jgi:hypothetical protein
MKVGITGHQRLKDPLVWDKVRLEIIDALDRLQGIVVAVTSLAIGADQLFAEIVLQRGGEVEAVIPFDGYELKFKEGSSRETYRQLLSKAKRVEVLVNVGSDEEAYFEAGKRVVDLSDMMIAVWDGQPAGGLGGTADVVDYSNSKNKIVSIIHV